MIYARRIVFGGAIIKNVYNIDSTTKQTSLQNINITLDASHTPVDLASSINNQAEEITNLSDSANDLVIELLAEI
ncbi:28389_t:CDS:2 [Dentiscutata erythropus]|uniref:28389_t:CDS:1 n=1 Tax=Dentiscutata erythropus TaxID=1348616 RepID=A0A9N8YYK0_9GLOM|nr:28389_t:CDS:2 [Dentiscutata erythropus]